MEELNYSKRLMRCFAIVSSTSDIRAKSDLFKIYTNCKNIYTELDRESVECRRLKRTTVKYTELEQKLDKSINEFEMWITFSRLKYV